MLVIFFACGLLLILVEQELRFRRQAGVAPRTWRELYQFTLKRNARAGQLDARIPAAFFAATAWLLFVLWEASLWAILGVVALPWWLDLLRALVFLAFFFWRRQQLLRGQLQLSRRHVCWLLAALTLQMPSLSALLLAPWLLWRTRL